MKMQKPHFYIVLVALAAVQLACDIETTPQADAGADAGSDVGADVTGPDIEEQFAQESYGIGASWYAYDSQTHSLTPHPRVYRATRGDRAWAFDVVTYYNDEGESGYFRLRVSERSDGSWTQPETIQLESSVKDAPVCVDLDASATVPCDDPAGDLVLRTDLRVVPAAGFAVQNPAIYAATHFSDEMPVSLSVQDADDIESVGDDWRTLQNSATTPNATLLSTYVPEQDGETSPLFLQAVGTFDVALWRMTPTADGLMIESTCVELSSDPSNQAPLTTDDLTSVDVSWPRDGGHLLSLCGEGGPSVVSSYDSAHRGNWPRTDGFALFIEQYDGEQSLRVAPGQLIWTDGQEGFDGLVSVPEHLWN
jgi:hypothetical protein